MNAKTYLSQAYRMNLNINSKLEQLEQLRAMTCKVTSTFREDKVSGTKDRCPMETAIIKVITAEEDINKMIDLFIDLKAEISGVIQQLDGYETRLLLELRYLCFNSWEEIAMKMQYKTSYIYKMHGRALRKVEKALGLEGVNRNG